MRKLIVSEFVSIDNVMEAPGPDGSGYKYAGWTFAYRSEEGMKRKHDELFDADALLLGRITYEGFAKAWPNMQGTGDFGERMNSIQKYVVSTTLQTADWNNTKIISGDVVAAIQDLKAQEGKNILVGGSGNLIDTLLKNNLVDQIDLMVYPVILGEGKRLFKEGTKVDLELVETKDLGAGVVLLSYKPKSS